MQLKILRTLDELRAFEPEWSALPRTSPFARWEYARSWHEQGPVEPLLMLVRDDAGQVIALAPWCLKKNRGGIRQVSGIWGYDAWFHDPWLRDRRLADATAALFIAGLQKARRDWDSIDLILRAEFSSSLIERMADLGWTFLDRPSERQNRVVDFGASWEAYWSSRSSEYRRTIRQAQKRLEGLDHRYLAADATSYHTIVEQAILLSQSRWDPAQDRRLWYEAIRALAAETAQRGELLAYGLEIAGRLAAVNVAFRQGDRAYGTLQGYDPEYARHGVGHLLTAWAYQRMAEAGIRSLDLGDGSMPWKDRVKTGETETVLVQVGKNLAGKGLVAWRRWGRPAMEGLRTRRAPPPFHGA